MELTQEHFDKKLGSLATKADLSDLATKVDDIETRMDGMATKDDLKQFATKDDLKQFATKDDLKQFATKDDLSEALKPYATKDDLSEALKPYATKDDLSEALKPYATKDDVKEAVREGYEDLARIVAEGFRGTDERAREHQEAMIELQGKVDQLVGTVKELAEMHRESMGAIKELSVGYHNHEVRITRIEQDRRGFQTRVA